VETLESIYFYMRKECPRGHSSSEVFSPKSHDMWHHSQESLPNLGCRDKAMHLVYKDKYFSLLLKMMQAAPK
jgi:hypothetical protein